MSLLILLTLVLFGILPAVPSAVNRNPHGDQSSRIMGGNDAINADYPYIVSLRIKTFTDDNKTLILGPHICAGSIYSENYIVTSGYCAEGHEATELTIAANLLTLNQEDTTEVQIISVSDIFIHEHYSEWNLTYNIALLQLETPLTLTGNVNLISLANAFPGQDTECDISGWGSTEEWVEFPTQLQAAKVHTLSRDNCGQIYGSEVDDTMICAGDDGKGACLGDSGGPLACNAELAGIVSWSYGCGIPGLPGVYTDVSTFKQWIEDHTS